MPTNTMPKRSSTLDRVIRISFMHISSNTNEATLVKFFVFCYYAYSVFNSIRKYFSSKDNGINPAKNIPPLVLDGGPVLIWHNLLDKKIAMITSKDKAVAQRTYIPNYNATVLQFLVEQNKAPVKCPNSQPITHSLQ